MHRRSDSSLLSGPGETNLKRLDNKGRAGVIGLGLLGSSVATCLLARGHPVIGIERDVARRSSARRRVLSFLGEMKAEKVLRADPSKVAARFCVSEHFTTLRMRIRNRIHR